MKIKAVLTATLFSLSLTSCSAWIHGNKTLADDSQSDRQLSAKIVDGKTTRQEVEQTFGLKAEARNTRNKSFPDGKYALAQYIGHLNDLAGTYAHRSLYVAYDSNNIVVNHAITTNNFREKNVFEKDPVNVKNSAFASLNKGDSQSKVVSLLGQPREATFTDNGSLLWIYSSTEISRDASSYIPLYNMVKGTESGQSDRIYVEFDRKNQLTNLYSVTVSIVQGTSMGNAWDYQEKIVRLVKKY
ncbi:hypothetical protein ACP26F_09110 [Franconibacter pulveris 1160]|uniref:hypothetical protein n=1 Tax=Franconibacter pulveris TaxID=435910 RepID=UPI000464F579|nr:hypothetical protein [Franconibacter pulveris]